MGFLTIDPAPQQAPLVDAQGMTTLVWSAWFNVLRDQLMYGDVDGPTGSDLPDPYGHLIHIKGGADVGLYSEKIVSALANSGHISIVGTVQTTTPLPATGGVWGAAFVGMAEVGGVSAVDYGGVFGITTEVWNGTAAAGSPFNVAMTAAEFAVIQECSNNNAGVQGLALVFKNRADGVTTVKNGIGSNKYGNNSYAIYLDAQPRSFAGEYCGWATGIYFAANSMDNPMAGSTAVGIDMHLVPYTKMDIGLWLSNDAKICFSSTATTCEMKYDPGLDVWGITRNGSPAFAIGMGGQMYDYSPTSLTVGSPGAAMGLPATPEGYVVHYIGGAPKKVPYYSIA